MAKVDTYQHIQGDEIAKFIGKHRKTTESPMKTQVF